MFSEDTRPFRGAPDTHVLDFWWRLPWVSKAGWIPRLRASSPVHNRFHRFISGVTPADLFTDGAMVEEWFRACVEIRSYQWLYIIYLSFSVIHKVDNIGISLSIIFSNLGTTEKCQRCQLLSVAGKLYYINEKVWLQCWPPRWHQYVVSFWSENSSRGEDFSNFLKKHFHISTIWMHINISINILCINMVKMQYHNYLILVMSFPHTHTYTYICKTFLSQSLPCEIFCLKPVFGACLYAVSHSRSLHTYWETQKSYN